MAIQFVTNLASKGTVLFEPLIKAILKSCLVLNTHLKNYWHFPEKERNDFLNKNKIKSVFVQGELNKKILGCDFKSHQLSFLLGRIEELKIPWCIKSCQEKNCFFLPTFRGL